MGNMSYCRFENTATDLREVVQILQEGSSEMNELSSYEINGLQEILDLASEIIELEPTIQRVLEGDED
tara:strand:- start:81 stop:284 length:204 start_codon:yes stop_codon:yes gene_type:complete